MATWELKLLCNVIFLSLCCLHQYILPHAWCIKNENFMQTLTELIQFENDIHKYFMWHDKFPSHSVVYLTRTTTSKSNKKAQLATHINKYSNFLFRMKLFSHAVFDVAPSSDEGKNFLCIGIRNKEGRENEKLFYLYYDGWLSRTTK